MELLHEALPRARRIAVFGDHEPIRNIRDLDNAARGFDVKINPFSARLEEEVIRGDSRDEGYAGRGSQPAGVANIVGRIPFPDP